MIRPLRIPVDRLVVALGAALVACALAAPGALAQSDAGSGEPTLEEDSGAATPKRTKDYRETLRDAIVDIQRYWAEEFPLVYGDSYRPIPEDRIIAAKPGVVLPRCQGQTVTYADAEDNAFYCYRSNFIVYDDVGLFPRLHRDFGGLAVPLVLAHEWGHAIEDRAGNVRQPTILKELQADCFAGSWLARVAAGDADRLELEGGGLDSSLAAMLSFRDPVGTSPEEEGAHGSGFDRTAAFQEGFDGGAAACVDYYVTPPTIVETPFTDEQDAATGGNVAADEVFDVAVTLLNTYYGQLESEYESKSTEDLDPFDTTTGDEADLPECGGEIQDADRVRNRVLYCLADGNIDYEQPYIQRVYDDIGDFGVVTLLANPFATYVQTIQGFEGAEDDANGALLGADCYTGGFARQLFDNGRIRRVVSLSPGDLDETLQALIEDTAARGIAPDLDATFYRVFAFRDGFFNGFDTCSRYEGASLSPG